MKKVVPVVAVLCLVLIMSCTKKISSNQGGTWSFKSNNYTATSFATGYGLVSVTNQPTVYSTSYTTLTVYFYGGLPTSGNYSTTYSGTDTVKAGVFADTTTQVNISLEINNGSTSTLYHATGGGGNQMINVSVVNANISISGTSIMMSNVNNPADSAPLSLNLIQP